MSAEGVEPQDPGVVRVGQRAGIGQGGRVALVSIERAKGCGISDGRRDEIASLLGAPEAPYGHPIGGRIERVEVIVRVTRD